MTNSKNEDEIFIALIDNKILIEMKFPEVEGTNLEGQKYIIPEELDGRLKLLIMPFKRWQQSLVNSWVPALEELQKVFRNFRFYEIPLLSFSLSLMRFVIDGGMKAGIPDKKVRERTLTIYERKLNLKLKLEIPNESTIYSFLVDEKGNIVTRFDGKYTKDKLTLLRNMIEKEL